MVFHPTSNFVIHRYSESISLDHFHQDRKKLASANLLWVARMWWGHMLGTLKVCNRSNFLHLCGLMEKKIWKLTRYDLKHQVNCWYAIHFANNELIHATSIYINRLTKCFVCFYN